MRGISDVVLRRFIKVFHSPGNLTYTQKKYLSFARMTNNVKIGTHDGGFHCDEALACFMLKTLPQYKDAVIVR